MFPWETMSLWVLCAANILQPKIFRFTQRLSSRGTNSHLALVKWTLGDSFPGQREIRVIQCRIQTRHPRSVVESYQWTNEPRP